ncbi:hypothetical protein EK21DRAFT_102562 [Setomelanomma holmii]|uniref:Zn(2)-C6 fungal-type domain-containing protein n=1 Tax=Setomelanomma holmii TaxID=210430 RepID=A0A9P4LKU0_9PLEO|nr:hypothetical protein EK21DRAFT_102562 [Setomelanomma holmii]
MKCEPQRDGPCKRCRNSKTECIFKPRPNARQPDPATSTGALQCSDDTSSQVMARLAVIESVLGISNSGSICPISERVSSLTPILTADLEDRESDPSLAERWQATANLRRFTAPKHSKIWSRPVVSQLWSYAIAEMSISGALKRSGIMAIDETVPTLSAQEAAYQNVLGLIIAGLVSEAFIDLTGIWISIGYRLIIDHCPVYIDQSANKWRQLFSGLQIIDLEHASLHLASTIVPIRAPLPSLRQLQSFAEDPFNWLTGIMHTGLGNFTGRGLPTIWSFISSTHAERPVASEVPFTDRDAQIRRQYGLHRLLVLSIYHLARGFDLFADTVATAERHELLLSARATLNLQKNDSGIWANWDLVMITWAAILVLQGLEGGVGEQDDLLLVQDHLNKLQRTKRPAPSLHHTLADRLETWLQSMNTPPSTALALPDFDLSWTLFDQNNMDFTSTSAHEQDPWILAFWLHTIIWQPSV